MFSLFALIHTGKTRLHTYYGSAWPFPASDMISFSFISRLSSKEWMKVFICFSFYFLDFLLNFPFSHTDKLLCMSGHWRGRPLGTRGGCGHGETVSGRGQGKVRLQLHNAVGNGYEDMGYMLFVSMVVRKLFFCIRCRRFPDESDNDITIRLCKDLLVNDLSSAMEPNNYNRYVFNISIPICLHILTLDNDELRNLRFLWWSRSETRK